MIGGKAISLRSRRNLTAGPEIAATQQQGLRTVEAIDAGKVGAWRQGRLVYLGATVAELVADANRYSAVPIEIAADSMAVADLQIRGAFVGRDVDRLLATLADIQPVSIDRTDPDRIVIRAREAGKG